MEDWIWSLFVWSTSICFSAAAALLLHHLYGRKSSSYSTKLPPGPRGWPIVGNLFDLGTIPHKNLASLRPKYGPVMLLHLGTVQTVVIQSAEAAKEMFKNHDLSFAGRTINETMRACRFDQGSMALSQYGPYWRMLRRLCTTELFTNKRINETAFLRRERVDVMIQWIEQETKVRGEGERETGGAGAGAGAGHFVFLMNFNLLGNLIFSRDLLDPKSKEGPEFFHAMDRLMTWVGKPNISDFFPILRWFDPQGLRKKMEHDLRRALRIVSGFVEDRIRDQLPSDQKKRKDFLDVLLEFEGDGMEEEEPAVKISDENMKFFILEIFLTGTETTSSTTEWALTELLRNPKSMKIVQVELAQVVGLNKKVEESNIDDLPYLQAVVKETLRLHPPIPLIPRRAVKDNFFMGYLIPKDTQVLVNAWAIGRDPDSWHDPLSFKPERFLGSDIDYRGHNFELIPYGAGRRICVGVPLTHKVLHLALGSLLHYFDWELDGDVSPDTIDMKERLGLALRKAVPLKAIPRKRLL